MRRGAESSTFVTANEHASNIGYSNSAVTERERRRRETSLSVTHSKLQEAEPEPEGGWMSKTLIALLIPLAAPAVVFAGAWTLPKGKMWMKVTVLQQHTDEAYLAGPRFSDGKLFQAGDKLAYPFDGEFDSEAVFIEAHYGLTDRLDLGVQIPYFDQAFSDATREESPSDAGFSDIRAFVKWRLLQRPALFTVNVGAKIPTGKFRNEDGLIPVGEGQWDFIFAGQLGRSFWPFPLYANLAVEYWLRTENKQILRDPGDQWFITGEVGYDVTKRFWAMVKYEVLRGKPSTDFGFLRNDSEIKRITYFRPALGYSVADKTDVELGVRFTLNGRNFPAGHQLVLGLSTEFDGRELLTMPW